MFNLGDDNEWDSQSLKIDTKMFLVSNATRAIRNLQGLTDVLCANLEYFLFDSFYAAAKVPCFDVDNFYCSEIKE